MYGDLIETFFTFRAKQANNSILTGIKYLQGNTSKYYFADAVFWGYPRFYLTSQTLKDQMVYFQLSESNREYEDFIRKCNVPELRNPIINLHNKLLKVEPGANIKDLNLNAEKFIPLGNKSDEYIVLLVKDHLDNNSEDPFFETRLKNFKEEFEKANLKSKIKICIITGESQKSKFNSKPELQKQLYFIPDKYIRDYETKVVSNNDAYLVIRNDGVIIDRWQNSKYLDSPYFIRKLIQDDVNTQRTKDSALGRVLTIIGTILISALITFCLVRYFIIRRERVKRQIQELELKAIRAQMNPHFTFNALSSIQNLISQKKENEANEYLVNFSKLLRLVLSSSEKRLIPLSDEITMLNLYLHLEQLRIPFDYKIHVDDNIDAEIEEIPSMLIQPIVENAVKHGIYPKGEGLININFRLREGCIYVSIIDNGKGFATLPNIETSGFGLKAVRERLSLLNKELHLNICLNIENIITNNIVEGCKVTLMIPV